MMIIESSSSVIIIIGPTPGPDSIIGPTPGPGRHRQLCTNMSYRRARFLPGEN